LDEKSGMNFSEYVAILSGNTDLLDKARLEKKVAALESERKSFTNNKAISVHKLEEIVRTVDGNNELVSRMGKDLETFNGGLQYDKDGSKLNPIQLEGVSGTDLKALAAKLTQINDNATTHGEHYKIGTLYGFNLLVKTENSQKAGLFMKENKFYVEGEGNVKYTYNNGHIANDPKLAVSYFLHALEKIPSLIEKYQADTEKHSKDIPVLQEVASSTWRKEDELKNLKTELAALNRKIQLSLKPIEQGEDKPGETKENKISVSNDRQDHSKKNDDSRKDAIQTIQDLMSGKLNPRDIPNADNPQERLREAKEVMGDRLVIASVGSHSKGFKL
jgi:hypothetical protein